MAERCKFSFASGVEMPAISGKAVCLKHAPVGTCIKCFMVNGEMEDTCRKCGAKLGFDQDRPRKLKEHTCYEDGPPKKLLSTAGGVPVPTDKEDAMETDMDVKDMLKHMMTKQNQMMQLMTMVTVEVAGMKQKVNETKVIAEKAVATANDAVKDAAEAADGVEQLRVDFEKLTQGGTEPKTSIPNMAGKGGGKSAGKL